MLAVLLLDDSSDLRTVWSIALKRFGYIPTLVDDVAAFWQNYHAAPWYAVILDMQIHGQVDAGDVIKRRLHQLGYKGRLIAMSGRSVPTDGWTTVLKKPFLLDELRFALQDQVQDQGGMP